jgi:hypothetical protein
LKNKQIFPHNVNSSSTIHYDNLCKQIWEKYEILSKLISLWTTSQTYLIELIILITTENNKHDHYFALELLLGVGWYIYNPRKLETSLEFIIGKVLGIYCEKVGLNEFDTAHVIDLITILFPIFYLPRKGFYNEKDKITYFERIVRFLYGIFSSFYNIIFIANICKIIFEPIRLPISKLKSEELLFLEDMEALLIYPLLERLKLNIKERYLYMKTWDVYGHFQHFLYLNKKHRPYGFDIISNKKIPSEATDVNSFFMESLPNELNGHKSKLELLVSQN